MNARIEVEKLDETEFRVHVIEPESQSSHYVTLGAEDRQRLCGDRVAPEEFIRRSFEFLLEREPKESILRRFDLSVISRYFPEYETEMKRQP